MTDEPVYSNATPSSIFRLSAVLFAWYLITYILLPVAPVRLGVDESWRAFLTWAFENHKQFGTEVIFTYGPWGFLLEPRGTVGIYLWQILGRAVLALAASSGIALIGLSWIRSAIARWIWAIAIVVLVEPTILIPVLLFLCTVSVGLEVSRKLPVLMLIAFAAGLAACTKFTCFVLVATLLPLLAMRKNLAPLLATSIASFLFFWLLASQRLANLPAFVRQSLEVSGGYASAMVAGRPHIELLPALLICGLPLVRWARRTLPPARFENVARLCWLAGCEFLIFKHGIIRSDPPHYYMALVASGAPVAFLLAPFPSRMRRASPWYRTPLYYALVVLALGGTLWSTRAEIVKRAGIFQESFGSYRAYSRGLPALLAPMRPASVGSGTVDVFPYELSYALERGLSLRNRPVIQAYSAYTRSLSEKDSAFLEGADAPAKIYFHVGPVDERYPSMEDSLAWRSMLTHYAGSSIEDGYLVLTRRDRPKSYKLKLVLDRDIRTDEALAIPDVPGGLVWAELEAKPTAAGRLLNLLYRNEKMALRVETNRRSLEFTLLDETAAIGFLLSPYVSDEASMLEIYKPESERAGSEKVRSILIHRGHAASLGFGSHVRVRLNALALSVD